MMKCIKNSVDAGHITLEAGQQVQRRIDEVLRSGIGPARARELVAQELEAERFEKKRRALLTEGIRQAREKDVMSHRDVEGNVNPADALVWLVEHQGQARFMDVEHAKDAIIAQAHAKLDALLHEARRGWITGDKRRLMNGQVKARMDNVVRELFGVGTGDEAAKGLAGAVADVFEDLRQRANAAGMAIRKLDNYGLPQHHNREALLSAGQEAWIKRISEDAYAIDWRTGNRIEGDELARVLEDSQTWGDIVSAGMMTHEPTGQRFGAGALFNRRQDHRFLHFKSPDKWIAYQRDFGEADVFATITGHVSSMARDIAAMEVLGPNPAAMREYLRQLVEQQAAKAKPVARIIAEQAARLKDLAAKLVIEDADYARIGARIAAVHGEIEAIRRKYAPQLGGKPSARNKQKLNKLQMELAGLEDEMRPFATGEKPVRARDPKVQAAIERQLADMMEPVAFPEKAAPRDYARGKIDEADRMWDHYTGTLNTPVREAWAGYLATGRNLTAASALGSAAVSSLTDTAFDAFARAYVGLPVRGVIADTVKMLQTDNVRYAVRSGLILDSALHAMHQGARYAGSLDTRTRSAFLTDRVLAYSGLSAKTQATKHAFGMAFMATWADHAGTAWADLPDAIRRTMARHGFTPAEWDQIRAARLDEPQPGATFLRAPEIRAAAGTKLAEKYIAMILRETSYAVPEGNLRSRARIVRERPGTLVGEISRNFAQFKSFGVVAVMQQAGRMWEIAARRGRATGAGYAAGLLLATTALGAFALQLKDLIAGRDPRDMTSKKFWGGAMLQGGGMGIYGDFLFADVNRFGGGLTSTVAGPLVGRVSQLRDTTIGNAFKGAEGEKSNIGRDAVQTLRTWTPGGSLWYARLAYERVLLDRLQEQVDPEAHDAFRRKIAGRRRDYQQGFWWRPGEAVPDRAPAMPGASR